jgi:outer membrane autotransporter protein
MITGDIRGRGGADTINLISGSARNVNSDDGNDTITINGGTANSVNAGVDNDTVTMDGGMVALHLVLERGADTFTMTGGDIGRNLYLGQTNTNSATDADDARLNGGTIGGHVQGDNGDDVITLDGTMITGDIQGRGGADTINLISGSVRSVDWGEGDETGVLDLSNVTVSRNLVFSTGADDFTLTAGNVGQNVYLGLTNATSTDVDVFTMTGGTIRGRLVGDNGADTVNLNGGTILNATSLNTFGGNDTINLNGATLNGQIQAGNGDDTFTWSSGTMASFDGGDGSDIATVTAAEYDGSQVLDGGDDVGLGDGFNDALTLDGLSVTVNAGGVTNWESVTVLDGTIDFGTSLTVGSGPDLGLIVGSGGLVSGAGNFSLTGDLETLIGGTYQSVSGGAVLLDIVGSLRNAGMVDVQDGFAGDSVTVSQNYSGAGSLLFDVDSTADTSDTLTISGDVVAGGTTIFIQDVSTGEASKNDILVVDVSGTTGEGDFMLTEDRVDLGGKSYELNLVGSQWFLQAVALAENLFYEAYPQHIRGLNELRSHRQRFSGRNWLAEGDHACQQEDRDAIDDMRGCRGSGVWMAMHGTVADLSPNRSSTQAELEISDVSYDAHRTRIEVGYEAPPRIYDGGEFVGTAMVFYGDGTLVGGSSEGNVVIDSEALGLGVGMTWYEDTGVYVDAQFQAARVKSDFTVDGVAQGSTHDANSYAASLEIGKVIPLDEEFTITPELQYMLYAVDFDDLVTEGGDEVGITDGISSEIRIGGTLEYSWNPETADNEDLYVTANLFRGLDTTTAINTADESLATEMHPWRGELGLGVVREWSNDHGARSAFYAEVSVGSHLGSGWGSGQRASGSVGIEFEFEDL